MEGEKNPGGPVDIDLSVNSFDANGRKYLVHDSIGIDRYEQYELLQQQIAWGIDFEGMFKKLQNLRDLLNKVQFVDASVQLENMQAGIVRKVEGRAHQVLLMCALFMNREYENTAVWDHTLALEKIADWKAANISMDFFFGFALHLVPGFTDVYKAHLAATSLPDPADKKKAVPL